MTETGGSARRALLALVIGQVCLHAAMAGVRMAAPLMVLRQTAGPSGWHGAEAAGLLLGLFAVAPVITALPAGRWVDRCGYHKPVHVAVILTLLGGACAVPAAWLVGWWQAVCLALAAMLVGTGANLGLIAILRSAGRLAAPTPGGDASAQLKRVFGWMGLAPSLSNALGPMLAGALIDLAGFGWAFGLLALLPLGTWFVARQVPRDAARPAPGGAVASVPSAWQGARSLLAVPGMRRLLLVNWFFSSSWDLHAFLVPLLGHELGLSASAIGSVLGIFALAVSGVRLLVPLVAERLHERQVLTSSFLAVAAIYAIYPWADNAAAMMVCAALLGAALGVVQPMVMTTLHHLAPPDRQGEAIALRSALINLSSATLPLLFGVLGATLGAAALFRGMALVVLSGTGLPRALRSAPHHD